jgi:putative membrane protein
LGKLSGKAFDREFLKTMISDHTRDISEFERVANQATNPDIKQFASEALPTLRDHLKMARDLAAGKSSAKTG